MKQIKNTLLSISILFRTILLQINLPLNRFEVNYKLKIGIFIFLVLLIINPSKLQSQEYFFKPDISGILSLEDGKKVLDQCSRSTPRKVKSFFVITNTEIEKLENNFKIILSEKAEECCISGFSIENLKKYGYQYIGVVIRKKRYIYINAFNKNFIPRKGKEDLDWINQPIVFCDGGASFWGVLFDLEKLEFKELAINGF